MMIPFVQNLSRTICDKLLGKNSHNQEQVKKVPPPVLAQRHDGWTSSGVCLDRCLFPGIPCVRMFGTQLCSETLLRGAGFVESIGPLVVDQLVLRDFLNWPLADCPGWPFLKRPPFSMCHKLLVLLLMLIPVVGPRLLRLRPHSRHSCLRCWWAVLSLRHAGDTEGAMIVAARP